MSGKRGISGSLTLALAGFLCLVFACLLLLPSGGSADPELPAVRAMAAAPERTLAGSDEPGRPASELLPGEKLDLNTASAQELQKLPGIGEKLSQAIVAWRDEHGPFRSVEELLQVPGIGQKRLEAIRDLVTVGDK